LLNLLSNKFKLISKHSLFFAELTLWGFVSVGVCRVFINGVNGLSSLLLGTSLIMLGIAIIFYAVSCVCRLLYKPKEKVRDYVTIRKRKD
jgi:hypothetical protein